MKPIKDVQLAAQMNEGSQTAAEELLRQYGPAIKWMARKRYVKNSDFDLEDLYQEGSLALLKASRGFRDDRRATFQTYSLNCIANGINSYLRNWNRKKREQISCETLPPIKSPYEKDQHIEALSQRLLVEEALGAETYLSNFEKTCLEHYWEDNTYKEIACLMDVETKRVENAMKRTKDKLRARDGIRYKTFDE